MRRAPVALVWMLALAAATIAPVAVEKPALAAGGERPAAETFPHRLSDAQFWQLVSGFSESGGTFISDNFVSNEQAFQEVVPRLQQRS